jgi:hypothetical protein
MFIEFKNVLGKLVMYCDNIGVCSDDVWMSRHSYALEYKIYIVRF